MHDKRHTSRRRFLGQSLGAFGGAAAAPYFFTAARAQQTEAPSDRVVIGSIGLGGMGRWDMAAAMQFGDVAAVCDVDAERARGAKEAAGGKAEAYEDYRRVLDRKDIQVVTISTPDHWHTKIAIEAMQAGKDVYCQKPLTLTIEEGQLICKVAKETGRVFQVGTQQRSENDGRFVKAVALVQSGRLGKIRKATCGINRGPASPEVPVADPPKELNWELWQGQAAVKEFRSLTVETPPEGFDQKYYSRGHYEFRWWYEYSGGKMTDWGAHHVDCAMWALGLDNTGPTSVRALNFKLPVPFEKGYPTLDDRYNTATEFTILAKFPEVELEITSEGDNGILFEGDKGRIFVNRDRLSGKPVEELEQNPLPEEAVRAAYKGKELMSHMQNFIHCVKTREEPISDVWSHHRSLTVCHLANIAMRLDREIGWDPEKERVVGDEEAQAFVRREQRKGYEIVV